jgi:hypothetical protein
MRRNIYIWHFSEAFRCFEGVDEENNCFLDASKLAAHQGIWKVPALKNANEQGLLKKTGDFPATIGFSHLISQRALDEFGEKL